MSRTAADADLRATAAGLVGHPDRNPAAPAARIVAALARNELRLAAARGESLLVTMGIPLAVLVFFSTVDVLPRAGGRPVDALLPGSLAIAVVASGLVALAIGLAYERAYGVLKRLAGTPARPVHQVIARILALLVIEGVQAILLVSVAAGILGWTPGPAASLPILLAAIALGTATFASLGVLLAGTLRAETTLAVANALFVVALLLGDAVVPVERLPPGLAAISGVLPFAPLVDLLRAGLGLDASEPARSAAVLGAWGIGGMLLAGRFGRWD